MSSHSPYRSPPVTDCRRLETFERVRSAFGSGREPLLDSALSDVLLFDESMPRFMRRIAGIVTAFYRPFLVREIQEARYIEDALPAASLLAYSENKRCIDSLGAFLRSSRPLEVVASCEALSDLVAYSASAAARKTAIRHLRSCGRELARAELERARSISAHASEEEARAKPSAWLAASAALISAASRFNIAV